MSPDGSLDCDFFATTINHWTHPDFAPGGFQIQHWSGVECLEAEHGTSESPLHHDGETVTWVQRLTIDDESGELTYEVLNGQSESWGAFATSGLKLTIETELDRLNDYRPAISINESGIGYAGNRVSSLVLEKLKWTTSDGETHQMVAPIDIDADIDP